MALKATIFKAELQIADMDRNYYHTHALTIARHPSETDERMMVRIVAFSLHAHEALSFTRGLSSEDEPDLWQKSLNDEIEIWIDLGQPDEKRVRKACGRARQVFIYTYQTRSATLWWSQMKDKLERFENLNIYSLDANQIQDLAKLAQRNMQLQCTIQDGTFWLTDGDQTAQVDLTTWKQC